MTDPEYLTEIEKDKIKSDLFESKKETSLLLFTGSGAGVGFCLNQVFAIDHPFLEGFLLLASAILFGLTSVMVILRLNLNIEIMSNNLKKPHQNHQGKDV